MTGFGAAPDELRQAANAINDTVQHVAGLMWQGPSGNYGHPGVQEGWGQFVDDAKSEIKKLTDATKGHGENLLQSAKHYLDLDEHVAGLLGKAVGDVAGEIGGAAAKGAHAGGAAGGSAGSTVGGGVGSAIGGAAGAIGGPGLAHAAGEVGGEVGSTVGGAVGSVVGSEAGAVGGAAAGAAHEVGKAINGGMRITGNLIDEVGHAGGSGITKEAGL